MLETPPSWSEGRPIPASSTLVVTYEVTVPLDAANGALTFPGYTWVGMIAAQGSAGDHFGYEDSPATITVQGGVDPGDPGKVRVRSQVGKTAVLPEDVYREAVEDSSQRLQRSSREYL